MKREGFLYGRNCSTSGNFEPIGGSGDCEARTVKQVSSAVSGGDLVSTYQLGVENSLKGKRGAAVMMLTFSQAVSQNGVSVTGEVSNPSGETG